MSKRSKTITIDYEVLNNLSKARLEFLKVFAKHGKVCNQKQLCNIFHESTGYSANYGTEIYSKLKPLLKAIVQKDFDVEFIKIPIESIAKFYNSIEKKGE